MNYESLTKIINLGNPVITILGNTEENLKLVLDELSSGEPYEQELKIFELNKDSLKKLDEFLLLSTIEIKIAICIFKGWNESVLSGILKKIEDVPKKTTFILLASELPVTILSRSILLEMLKPNKELKEISAILNESIDYLNLKFPEDIDKDKIPKSIIIWFEKKVLETIRLSKKEFAKRNRIALFYQIWNKFTEVEYWLNSGQIDSSMALEMLLSILSVGLKKVKMVI